MVRVLWKSCPILGTCTCVADRARNSSSLSRDIMASGRGTGVRQVKESDGEAAKLRQLVQTLRGDLNLLSNEARKKYPAVREVSPLSPRLSCAAYPDVEK